MSAIKPTSAVKQSIKVERNRQGNRFIAVTIRLKRSAGKRWTVDLGFWTASSLIQLEWKEEGCQFIHSRNGVASGKKVFASSLISGQPIKLNRKLLLIRRESILTWPQTQLDCEFHNRPTLYYDEYILHLTKAFIPFSSMVPGFCRARRFRFVCGGTGFDCI